MDITQLQALFGDLPKQGTPEWLQSRKSIVGGSEIAKVMHGGKGAESLVVTKKHGTSFTGNVATKWGKIFEPVAIAYIESLGYKHYEFGSVPVRSIPRCSYSPDGLLVLDGKIFLLEIKCPFSTAVDGKVPKKYMPQVQLGLVAFPEAVNAIFMNCKFTVGIHENAVLYGVFDIPHVVEDPDFYCTSCVYYCEENHSEFQLLTFEEAKNYTVKNQTAFLFSLVKCDILTVERDMSFQTKALSAVDKFITKLDLDLPDLLPLDDSIEQYEPPEPVVWSKYLDDDM